MVSVNRRISAFATEEKLEKTRVLSFPRPPNCWMFLCGLRSRKGQRPIAKENGRPEGRTDGRKDKKTDGRTEGWTEEWTEIRSEGQKDGRKEGQKDGRKEGMNVVA